MEAWARDKKLGFIKASAKTGENVAELFDMAAQGAFLIRNAHIFEKDPHTAALGRKSSGCC
jgi:translation initiation factor IF-2